MDTDKLEYKTRAFGGDYREAINALVGFDL